MQKGLPHTNQKRCFWIGLSGGVYIVAAMVEMLPTRLTPKTTPETKVNYSWVDKVRYSQGLADINRNTKPDLKICLAATAVTSRPPAVYLKLSLRYERSPALKDSRVSLFRVPSRTTTATATPAYANIKDNKASERNHPLP